VQPFRCTAFGSWRRSYACHARTVAFSAPAASADRNDCADKGPRTDARAVNEKITRGAQNQIAGKRCGVPSERSLSLGFGSPWAPGSFCVPLASDQLCAIIDKPKSDVAITYRDQSGDSSMRNVTSQRSPVCPCCSESMHISRLASHLCGSLTPMFECYRCDVSVKPQASEEASIRAAPH
jgi:hypothetical protein